MLQAGISDHGALLITPRPRQSLQPAMRPVPHWAARSPEFARRLLALERADGLRGMSAHGRLERHKELIREAARGACDELAARSASSPDARAAVLVATGSAIAADHRRLAERLHARHPVVREQCSQAIGLA